MQNKGEQLILSFETAAKLRTWLSKNHASAKAGVLLRIFKKNSGHKSVTYDEALDEALCFGWIDGQKKSHDNDSWIQKFTPRRQKSMWSKRNREHIARLTKAGRMKSAGLKAVEAAKKDGRWDGAYDSPKSMDVPADFLRELKKNKKAYAFLLTLNKANTYAVAWRLHTAKKPETREKRKRMLLDMLGRGEKLH